MGRRDLLVSEDETLHEAATEMSGGELDDTELTATLLSMGIDPEGAESSTLRPSPREEILLPALTSTLTFVEELGRGGQAVVELARQDPLGREVAVKRPVDDPNKRKAARAALIVEGRICSQLDHPNIIPVYDLGIDKEGRVALVMKRVRGETWRDQLRRPELELPYHLHVLQAVCRAVQYAHDHGVLHRDIKPANVMIDETGQVYLVDWGVALALDDRAPEGVPRQRKSDGPAGTPGYMAPEMAWPGARLDERADVFLLGSVLYALLSGRAPNRGKSMLERIKAAYRCDAPSLPAWAPGELVDICHKARDRALNERYPSAEALRRALVEFDQHASARALVEQGEARLDELAALAAEEETDRAASRLFTEARFAFAQALVSWPGSEHAHAGGQRALTLMARRELRRGRVDSAERLAHELDAPMAEVEEALADARRSQAELEAAAARAAELEHQTNFRVGRKPRTLSLFALASGWALFQFATGAAVRRGLVEVTSLGLAVSNFALCVVSWVVIFALWRRAARNRAGRRVVITLNMGVAGIAAQWFLLHHLGVGPNEGMAVIHVVIALGFVWLSTEDRLWGPAALAACVSIPVIFLWPAAALETNGLVVSVAFLSAALPTRWRESNRLLSRKT